jgi:hypothetical protein
VITIIRPVPRRPYHRKAKIRIIGGLTLCDLPSVMIFIKVFGYRSCRADERRSARECGPKDGWET